MWISRFALRVIVHSAVEVAHREFCSPIEVAIDADMRSRRLKTYFEMLSHRLIEDFLNQSGFSGAAHAGNHSHHAERELHIHPLEVVGGGATHQDVVGPAAALLGHRDRALPGEILESVARGSGVEMGYIALIYHLAAFAPGLRTDVDKIVGGTNNLLVMLHNHHGVAYLLEHSQHIYKFAGVLGVQSNARLVENIQGADEAAAQ